MVETLDFGRHRCNSLLCLNRTRADGLNLLEKQGEFSFCIGEALNAVIWREGESMCLARDGVGETILIGLKSGSSLGDGL